MAILDTNIFIYLANGTLSLEVIKNIHISFASITKIEALGYSKITALEQRYVEELFGECEQHDLDKSVIEQAISIRQQQSISLGDAIVAATAIANDSELWTANTGDFASIEGLKLVNPLGI